MGIRDKLKGFATDYVFEDSGEAKKVEASTPAPGPPVVFGQSAPARSADTSWTPSPSSEHAEAIYQRLVQRTAISSISELASVNNFMNTLSQFIPDKALRLKAAVAQAQAAGINTNNLGLGFDNLMGKLEEEKRSFSDSVTRSSRVQIDDQTSALKATEGEITEKRRQISELEVKRDTLQAQIRTAQDKIETTKHDFEGAYQRRKSEIESLRREFVS